jgi:hypothetical protein
MYVPVALRNPLSMPTFIIVRHAIMDINFVYSGASLPLSRVCIANEEKFVLRHMQSWTAHTPGPRFRMPLEA